MTASASRRRGLWLVAGLVLYALFLLATAPASIVSARITAASAGTLDLHRPHGTIWHGSGVLIANIPAQDPLASRVSWDINPLWLLAGSLQVHVEAGDPAATLDATARFGYHRIALRNVSAEFPASTAGLVYPPSQLVSPTGQVRIRSDSLTLNRDGLSGNVEISWLNASVRMAESTVLGDYRVDVSGRGPVADLRVSTLRGPLEATGQGQWRVLGDGNLSLRGTVTARAGAPPSVAPLADMLARNGLNVNARLPLGRWIGLPAS